MSRTDRDIVKSFVRLQEKLGRYEDDLQTWTSALEELSEIEKAFQIDKMHGMTILDIGTDSVKPLYIALKYEPDRIIGINEELYSFTSDIKQNSRPFVKTDIEFYECSCFNKERLNEILTKENQKIFNFILLSKTLHHLRTGECIAKKRDSKHICHEDEETCIYRFNEQEIFEFLLKLGKRVIVYENFYPGEKDNDKIRGRGGYFTINEWEQIFGYLKEKYRVEMIQPIKCSISTEEIKDIITKLRQVDSICFYVEIIC